MITAWERVGEEGIYRDILFIEGYGNSSNVYAINCDELSLIDTGNDYTIFFELKDIRPISEIRNVFLTHSHNDHSLGLLELLRGYADFRDVKVFVHEIVKDGLERRLDRLGRRDIKVIGLRGGEILKLGDYKFKVLYTPGHTIDSMCLYCEEHGVLFSGDSVVVNPVIDERMGGNLRDYILSLRFLRKLNVKAIFPGHGYYATERCKEILDRAYLNAISLLAPDKPLKDAAISALKAGLIDEAEFALEKYLESEHDIDALMGLASIKADKGLYNDVLKLLSNLIDKNDFEALKIAAMAAMNVKRYDDAIKFFKRALEIKHDKKLKIMLGAALYESGRRDEALKIEEFKEVFHSQC